MWHLSYHLNDGKIYNYKTTKKLLNWQKTINITIIIINNEQNKNNKDDQIIKKMENYYNIGNYWKSLKNKILLII